jgi:hypothetical protein
MQSSTHKQHIAGNISHNNCSECRADNERQFARIHRFEYRHVHEYLTYVRPRIEALRKGENSVNARIWHRDFLKALHNRIESRMPNPVTRKRSHSYLERLKIARFPGNRTDFREFARKGASCL